MQHGEAYLLGGVVSRLIGARRTPEPGPTVAVNRRTEPRDERLRGIRIADGGLSDELGHVDGLVHSPTLRRRRRRRYIERGTAPHRTRPQR